MNELFCDEVRLAVGEGDAVVTALGRVCSQFDGAGGLTPRTCGADATLKAPFCCDPLTRSGPFVTLERNAAIHSPSSTLTTLAYDNRDCMAMKQKKTRQASRQTQASRSIGEWSGGHTLNEWADYLDTTCAEAAEKFKRWECRGTTGGSSSA